MSEQNFHFRARYGLTESLFDFEWKATVTSIGYTNEDQMVEGFREFYRHIIDTKGKFIDEVQDMP